MDFFTSDTHFGHVNIIAYCNRPFASVPEMNEGLIRRWNDRVGPNDTVYHLGDFAMGPKGVWREYRRRLNGRIVFTLGNHDAPLDRFRAILRPDDEWGTDRLYTSSSGLVISLAHIPPDHDEVRPGEGRLLRSNSTPQVRADLAFCGHVHTQWQVNPKNGAINVGVDIWGYEPKTLDDILEATGSNLARAAS
jgi:calcineurin-like phosphoesterase family protein